MPRISVLAGTNGAGKSSIAGAMLRSAGGQYYNPDEETKHVLAANPGMDPAMANGLAWQAGISQLRAAIETRQNYIFETTLGGDTVTALLLEAAAAGLEVWVWYCGLDGPDRHLSRIRSRVARGGHDIPEEKVRARYIASRRNLVRLMPHVSRLTVYDNSVEADPASGRVPKPRLLLDVSTGAVIFPETQEDLRHTPAWAQPLVACAYGLAGR
jgi:predicted ABC-type ATPase